MTVEVGTSLEWKTAAIKRDKKDRDEDPMRQALYVWRTINPPYRWTRKELAKFEGNLVRVTIEAIE